MSNLDEIRALAHKIEALASLAREMRDPTADLLAQIRDAGFALRARIDGLTLGVES